MISLKKASLSALSLLTLATLSLNGDEPVCHHCEEIREYNAKYHENFEYYDEYVKTHEDKGQKAAAVPSADQVRKETPSTTKTSAQPSSNKTGSPKLL